MEVDLLVSLILITVFKICLAEVARSNDFSVYVCKTVMRESSGSQGRSTDCCSTSNVGKSLERELEEAGPSHGQS